jgi:acyl-CoA synthetase (AMP-forming)/AMP-acid ligase II
MAERWQSPVMHNVAGALTCQAERQPDQPAIHYPAGISGGRIEYRSSSYAELDELSNRWSHGLQSIGIGRGTRTALMVPPGLDFFAVFFALFKSGAVPVLIDPGIGLRPLRACLAEARPEAFIGISRAQLARTLLRWAPDSIDKTVTLGPRLGWGGFAAREVLQQGAKQTGAALEATRPEEMAAILFTSGSTGIPKGVVYRHRHFTAQVDMLRQAFDIQPGEVSLPTFPPFALFDPALGMTSVIPHMDPTRPARANPALLVQAIERFGVSNIFGSPALARVLGEYAVSGGLKLNSVRRIISAGAAVPIEVIRTLEQALPEGSSVHTPYGATECLPVSNISSREMTPQIEEATRAGAGICVGAPVPPNRVEIIPISDQPEPFLDQGRVLPPGEVGEIVVHGPTATDQYWQREEQTRLAKTVDLEGATWHRMGDVGYRDDSGRLWYCGRKSQRVRLGDATLFADQLEAVFNTHPAVRRSALVGANQRGTVRAVLCIEPLARLRKQQREEIRRELLAMARANPRTRHIETVLFHRSFPVDIRHNAKIGRERLAQWASKRLT